MTDSRPVAFVGATGFLGRPVVERLLAGAPPCAPSPVARGPAEQQR